MQVGDQLGEYRLLERIGKGGTCEVFKASHPKHGEVALKLVLEKYLGYTWEMSERLMEEGEILERLKKGQARHIIQPLEYGRIDSQPYLALPLLRGRSLDRCLNMEVNRAVKIFRKVAEAVADAHALDVIHRDIKPDNIFLQDGGPEDKVTLLDFSLGRYLKRPARLTRCGVVFGTPEFMSPQQETNTYSVDGSADIWSLGATMYFVVSGKDIHYGMRDGRSVQVSDKNHPLSTTSLHNSVPQSLWKIIRKTQEPITSNRPTAAQLLTLLEAYPV